MSCPGLRSGSDRVRGVQSPAAGFCLSAAGSCLVVVCCVPERQRAWQEPPRRSHPWLIPASRRTCKWPAFGPSLRDSSVRAVSKECTKSGLFEVLIGRERVGQPPLAMTTKDAHRLHPIPCLSGCGRTRAPREKGWRSAAVGIREYSVDGLHDVQPQLTVSPEPVQDLHEHHSLS